MMRAVIISINDDIKQTEKKFWNKILGTVLIRGRRPLQFTLIYIISKHCSESKEFMNGFTIIYGLSYKLTNL